MPPESDTFSSVTPGMASWGVRDLYVVTSRCMANCISCNGTYCITCVAGLYKVNGYNCSSSCAANQYRDNVAMTCTNCAANCASCNSTNCFACYPGLYLMNSTKCLRACPAPNYYPNSNKICTFCNGTVVSGYCQPNC